MTAHLSLRPAMRDSGLGWLGAIPAHWEVRRIRNLAQMRVSNVDKISQDHERPVRLCNYSDVYYNERISADMPFMRATASSEEIARFRLRVGDVLITKDSEAWNDIGVPAYVESSADDLVSGYHLALLRPDPAQLNGAYLNRALSSFGVASQLYVRANGVTRYGLPQNAILSLWLPVPPVAEQAAIVRFLDHADERIQRYIRAKEKLIALLEEQKQAAIHDAVTGQIDVRTGQHYPAYKESGLSGPGAMPEHWQARKLKTVCQIRYGLGQPPPEHVDGLPLIRATNVSRGRITEKDLIRVDPSTVPASRNAVLQEGEIVVVRSGAYTADSAIIPHAYAGAISGYDMVVTAVGAQPRFVAAALLCPYLRDDQLVIESMRAAQPHLNAEELGSAVLLLPPRCEQSAIVQFLDQVETLSDSYVARASRQVELMREFRVRLIADVVTGNLDVRGAAAKLREAEPSD
ncbi:MAG: hypothetical protein F4X04_14525 [Holophagales bacterium]|nr:hypothetical protein [Holophagales bacterium]